MLKRLIGKARPKATASQFVADLNVRKPGPLSEDPRHLGDVLYLIVAVRPQRVVMIEGEGSDRHGSTLGHRAIDAVSGSRGSGSWR